MDTLIHPLYCEIAPPQRFTFPFCYEPHDLCIAAAEETQRHISATKELCEEADKGKMFGVLVVEHKGRTGFIAAYSGLLGGRCDLPWFVPPVYDSQQPDGHFKTHEAEITEINRRLDALEHSAERKNAVTKLEAARREATDAINRYKAIMTEAKRRRDNLRGCGEADNGELTRESQFMKAELRRIKQRHAHNVELAETAVKRFDEEMVALKRLRRNMSDSLQQWLFGQYRVLNAKGESRTLTDIFAETTRHIPPSGAGDCCAPKLLQYAYRHGLRPLCMAEFWWGASPRAEIRHHLHYYPACRGKCKPILGHMLAGLDVDPDPQISDTTCDTELETMYEDAHLAVVCKPAGMLSVPGKTGRHSVLSIMRHRYPEAEGPMIVHRLDMSTSGILVVAKTTAAYHHLQIQFAERTIGKRYVAMLDGRPDVPERGTIALPLCPDPLDRPRQTVDRTNGKAAITEYSIISTNDRGRTLIHLHPLTGRTHQLRVHCAHPDGLATPIVGDELYGHADTRLCLHAETLEFTHPETGERMVFRKEAEFL